MVWFQCEDCGENLKKPKLPNHFRICSAAKLSCIDCGEIFGQDSVQQHTQCITEAEKYGPKGQGKFSNRATPKAHSKSTKQQHADVDINVGLSDRPPWFCSICNTKATSRQTLLLHADGKKHQTKARAIHAAKQQQAKQAEGSAENGTNGELHDNRHVEAQNLEDLSAACMNSKMDTGNLQSKKRKLDESGSDGTGMAAAADTLAETYNGIIQKETAKAEGKECRLKKAKFNYLKNYKMVDSGSKEDFGKKIKLKKLIKAALRTNPHRVLKMKKLKKLVLKSLRESGITENSTQLNDMLEQKIRTSSRFRVDNKYVHLVIKG